MHLAAAVLQGLKFKYYRVCFRDAISAPVAADHAFQHIFRELAFKAEPHESPWFSGVCRIIIFDAGLQAGPDISDARQQLVFASVSLLKTAAPFQCINKQSAKASGAIPVDRAELRFRFQMDGNRKAFQPPVDLKNDIADYHKSRPDNKYHLMNTFKHV